MKHVILAAWIEALILNAHWKKEVSGGSILKLLMEPNEKENLF